MVGNKHYEADILRSLRRIDMHLNGRTDFVIGYFRQNLLRIA